MKYFLTLVIILLPIYSVANALNCPGNNSLFDQYLCDAYEIAALDTTINKIYAAAIQQQSKSMSASYNRAVQTEQLDWLKQRDQCLLQGDRHGCLVASYKNRIAELKAMLPQGLELTTALQNDGDYTVEQLEYSAWSSREEQPSLTWPWQESKPIKRHYFRKKSVLINTKTGDTWGLEYTGNKSTSDGYSWVKIDIER